MLQKYNDLQENSAKEITEIKIEFDSKIDNMRTEFNEKFHKKGMTLKYFKVNFLLEFFYKTRFLPHLKIV